MDGAWELQVWHLRELQCIYEVGSRCGEARLKATAMWSEAIPCANTEAHSCLLGLESRAVSNII